MWYNLRIMWRNRRRTIIVLILLAALFLLVILPVWLSMRKTQTCFDAKQNQNESGVDCGGSCTLMCKGTVKGLKVVWAKMFPIRHGAYDVVAYVENPNSSAGAPRLPYTAKLFDAEGVVIAERRGETFAAPNERFAIFVGNMLSGEKVPVKGTIEIGTEFVWVKTDTPKKELAVEDKVLVGTDNVPKLSALLVNSELDVLRDIEVTVVVYDVTGAAVAVSSTKVGKIDRKGSERLFFTWPKPLTR